MLLKPLHLLNESLEGTLPCWSKVEQKRWYSEAVMIEMHVSFSP